MTSNDIYSILSSKSHNPHYLNRYYKFILLCTLANKNLSKSVYTENHHICPKAKDLFPKYTNLKIFPWNSIKLTRRQHILSHYLLAKSYNTWGMWEAVSRIINQRGFDNKDSLRLLKLSSNQVKINKRGVFTRGYLEDGTPNVKQSTKDLLFKLKTEYYLIPENIERCKEIRKSDAYINADKLASERFISLNKSRTGIPLTEESKLKNSISNKIKRADKEFRKSIKTFKLYITPIGVFSSTHKPLCSLSTKENTIINSHHTKGTSIISNKVKGMTFFQLGFYIITKDHPEFELYYERLDQVHQPEPNHPLWSELNDFLLQQKLLP